MISVLFVCHGNICRSPMGEFLLKSRVEKLHLAKNFTIASAATSTEEIGNPVYPPVMRLLKSLGIDASAKRARQITADDLERFDYVLIMDSNNRRNLDFMFGGRGSEKIFRCLDFTPRRGQDIADPWYTDDFESTRRDLEESLDGFLDFLRSQGRI